MKDLGFFVGFFAILVYLAITVGGEDDTSKGLFSSELTDTPTEDSALGENSDLSYTNPDTPPQPSDTDPTPQTQREIEDSVAQLYEDLDVLQEEVRYQTLHSPRSPYADIVTLTTGSVSETVPLREYLTLSVDSSYTGTVSITGWTLESYVSDEEATIPKGDRVLERYQKPVPETIMLLPGEEAYLVTGDSSLNTSFRENICTGYLAQKGNVYPGLSTSCPYPLDELKESNDISLGNDDCYEFVESIGTCSTPSNKTVMDDSTLGKACREFLLNTFTHDDCVRLHGNDPLFSRDGYWYIYLKESTDLWREEREIIRLLDTEGRVVDVIEY